MTGSLLDSVLDRSVIGGYTNVGYRIRSRGWSGSELPSLDGRVVMVTGATSGLGARPRRASRASARPCGWSSAARTAASGRAP